MVEIKGQCPKCKSENLEYGDYELNDTLDFPFTCNNCGHKDVEMNYVEFCGYASDYEETD